MRHNMDLHLHALLHRPSNCDEIDTPHRPVLSRWSASCLHAHFIQLHTMSVQSFRLGVFYVSRWPSACLCAGLHPSSPSEPLLPVSPFILSNAVKGLRQCLNITLSLSSLDQVRRELDGRHIPRHLLNDTLNPPMFKISFSQHSDLNVKFQSHRSR